MNVITTQDAASKNRNRVTRIANGQVSIFRDSIEWTNGGDHPVAAKKRLFKFAADRRLGWIALFVLRIGYG